MKLAYHLLVVFCLSLFLACGTSEPPKLEKITGTGNQTPDSQPPDDTSSGAADSQGTSSTANQNLPAPQQPTEVTGLNIISDFDDTLQITNTTEYIDTVINSLFVNKPFSAMDKLFAELNTKAKSFSILSGSPTLIESKIKDFLSTNKFPAPQNFYLKDLTKGFSTVDHKKSTLTEIAKTNPDKIIFLGDDIELDHEIYLEYKKNNPGKVLTIYIHRITGKSIPPDDLKLYHTAFDIAFWEAMAMRLSFDTVKAIGQVLLSDPIDQVKPDYMACPTDNEKLPIANGHPVYEIYQQIWQKLKDAC